MTREKAAKLIEECGKGACNQCSKKGQCQDEDRIDAALGMAIDALKTIEAIRGVISDASKQINEIKEGKT